MSIPCPVPMLPGVSGKAALFVLAALIVMVIIIEQNKPPAAPTKSQP